MSREQKWELAGWGSAFIAFAFGPILLAWLRLRNKPEDRTWAGPMALAVLSAWILQMFYRDAIEVPINMARAAARGDLMYDGVGGSAAIMLMGWVMPLLSCTVLWMGWSIGDGIRRWRNKGRNKAPSR